MKIKGQLYAVEAKQRAYAFRGTKFSAAPAVYLFVGSSSECQGECDRLIAEQAGLWRRVNSGSGTSDAGATRLLAIKYQVVPVKIVPM